MKRLTTILKNNQSGFAYLLTVIILSATVLTSLSLVYVYSVNRLRYQTRIKEAYKLLNVTETAAKTVKSAWDKEVIAQPGASDSTIASSVSTNLTNAVDDAGTCAQMCQTAYGTDPATVAMCFPNQDNANFPYCFTGNPVAVSYKMVEPKNEFGKFEKFIAKLEGFFDDVRAKPIDQITFSKPTLLGWVFKNTKALANYPEGGGQTITCQSPMYAAPTNVGGRYVTVCKCPQEGYTFNGSACVPSTTVGSDPITNEQCSDTEFAANNPGLCTTNTKVISPNSQANCNQTPKPASCARCFSSDGDDGQNSACGTVSARLPGTASSVQQTFRISKSNDFF